MNRLRTLFRDERKRQGFTYGDLARMCGYKNISKGGSRIAEFERTGAIHTELLEKLAAILGIDRLTIQQLADLDWADYEVVWNAWADEKVEMRIVMRVMACMYVPRKVPPGLLQEEAEEYAAKMACEAKKRCCLALSRRESVWFDEQGQIVDRTYAKLGDGPNWPVWGVE